MLMHSKIIVGGRGDISCRPKPQGEGAAGDQIGRPYKARFRCTTYLHLLLRLCGKKNVPSPPNPKSRHTRSPSPLQWGGGRGEGLTHAPYAPSLVLISLCLCALCGEKKRTMPANHHNKLPRKVHVRQIQNKTRS